MRLSSTCYGVSKISQRDERLEYLRVFACFGVILGHISNWYMRAYPDLPFDSYICASVFNGLCRVSVPIFFMISGALILEQNTDYKKNTKRALSILIKTVVWTIVFLIWDYFYLGERYDIHEIFAVPIRVHFWFLYVIFGIYLTVPLWQKLVKDASKELIKYFSVLFISVLTLSFIIESFKMHITYEIPLVGASCYACYFIMGYIIRHYIDEIKIKRWIYVTVWALCVTATILLTLLPSIKHNEHIESFSDFRSAFIGLSALAVFCLFMKAKPFKHNRIISLFSRHSFNIYMIHVFFLDIIQVNIDITKFSAWIGIPVFFIFLLILSLVCSILFELAKGKKQIIL
ncbi:MAG: hypothetical protein E7591_07660 [Ruminococcaceae bacterium]|nr:hypothetical protein [Oscillospiraceae bacterium]